MLLPSCANIVPPTGGARDVTPPKLLLVSPADSQLNTRITKVQLRFNEFITLDNPSANVQLSPLLPIPLDVQFHNRSATVRIPDSLLLPNTTYHLTFGNAIKDVHEGNAFGGYSYTFSTGPYFDSLTIKGRVLDATTGLPDSAAQVLLYDAAWGDSAILRRRPLYATHVDAAGGFSLEGLPGRAFRLYALRDANNNLTYDGAAEWIAFLENPVLPRADTVINYELRTFPEVDENDTAATAAPGVRAGGKPGVGRIGAAPPKPTAGALPYRVLADTSSPGQRTQDISKPLRIVFAQRPKTISPDKIFLLADSAGITTEQPKTISQDSFGNISMATPWLENTTYELRLQKGFATDTAGADLLPGRFPFRTRRSSDYAKLSVQVGSAYYGAGWVLQITTGADTVWQKPVTDSLIVLKLLEPATYVLRMIKDDNRNGRWDAGALLQKRQPELVVPYDAPQPLKAGWEHNINFIPGVRKPRTGLPGGKR